MPRREHKGSAAGSTLDSGINATALTITLAAGGGTGWPDGSVGPFIITIDRGEAAEERVLVTSRAGDVLTVASTGDRGIDDTTATTHSAGAVVEHTLAALEVDEHNTHMFTTSRDDHTQYMKADGTRHDLSARHTVGTVVPTAVPVATGTANAEGVAATAARSDHVHDTGDLTVGTAELQSDAVTTAKIAAGAVGTSELAADSVTNAKIADDAVAGENVSAFAEEISGSISAWGPISVNTDILTVNIPSRAYRRVVYLTAHVNWQANTDQSGDVLIEWRTATGGGGTLLNGAGVQFRQTGGANARQTEPAAVSHTVEADVEANLTLRLVEVQGTINIASTTSPGARPGSFEGIVVPIGKT